jgi:hypothetical protein
MVTHVNVKDDYGANSLPYGTTSIFSVGYISNTAYPKLIEPHATAIKPEENETEIIYLATGGGKQKDIDTDGRYFIKAVTDSGVNMAHQPITDGIYATVAGNPVYKLKMPIVKGHDYTNIIRDLGNNKGTLYQVIDNTSGQQDSFIDHSLKGKSSGASKQILNFDEWHTWRGENDANQDIGPTARRYDINVTEPPKYIINNADPTKSGTLSDAGTPVVKIRPREPLSDPEFPENPDFPTTTPQTIGYGSTTAPKMRITIA